MTRRLQILSIFIALIGVGFLAAGGFAYLKTQEGYRSLNAFSAAQNVTLTYNEEGQLVDRGEVEGAQAIMALLRDDWGFPVVSSELDASDPVINTASEYMFQMATVTYHTLHGATTVVLSEDVEYNGEVFAAGEYEFVNDGRYWVDFDRSHPIEGPARAQIWTPTAHALIGELGVGTATASALQLGLGLAALFAGVGAAFLFTGAGLFWAMRPETEPVPVLRTASVTA
ncbi:MAG TPA: hypothetical protein VFH90_10475 [Candidatus Limnocylindria bacterium]|nr:hypothetical protein [Candidatus Limnocylindria bacterium]